MPKRRRVREEIGQTRPFRSEGQEAVIALWRTADVLKGFFGRLFGPHGLTVQQYNVLRILRGAEPEGLPTLAIAKRMVERAPGITRMIDRLETKGLVGRERRNTDRRCVHCRITPKGLRLLERLDAPIDAADDAALAMLGAQEIEELTRLLDAIRAGHAAES